MDVVEAHPSGYGGGIRTRESVPAARTDTGDTIRLRPPVPADGAGLWRLAGETGLDLNSPYAYVMWGEYFSSASVVAEVQGDVRGFVMGFRPPADPATVFVWQVAVHPDQEGTGLASRLLDHVAEPSDLRYLEATVTPSNQASARLFERFAARHDAPIRTEELFGADLFAGDAHEAELRVRIGPFGDRT